MRDGGRARLMAVIGLLMAGRVVVTLLAALALLKARQDGSAVLSEGAEPLILAADLRALVLTGQGQIAAHVAARSDNEKARLSQALASTQAEIARKFALLRQRVGGPGRDFLDRAAQASDRVVTLRGQVIDLSLRNSTVRAAVLSTNAMPAVRARLNTAMAALGAAHAAEVQLIAAQVEAEANGIAAAEKNALLNPEDGFITRQLAAAGEARQRLQSALSRLDPLVAAPALARVTAAAAEFAALDDQISALIRANTTIRAEDLMQGDLAAAEGQMLDLLAGLSGLAQTRLRQGADQLDSGIQGDAAVLCLAALIVLLAGLVMGLRLLREPPVAPDEAAYQTARLALADLYGTEFEGIAGELRRLAARSDRAAHDAFTTEPGLPRPAERASPTEPA